MLRLPSQRSLKALHNTFRNPLRNRLPNRLGNPLQTRQIHLEQAPFSGPPSYATIARRFSSHPNPLKFFAEKKANEAIARGDYIDIHDISGVDPNSYDVLITDINDNTLRSNISDFIGIPYLREATKDDANKKVQIGHSFIYGQNFRTIFPCVVSYEDKAHWVFFIVSSGAPLTYLSASVSIYTYKKNAHPLTIL